MKHFDEFLKAGVVFNEFCMPGEEVDEELYLYFMNILPPISFSRHGFQVAEVDHYVFGRAVFATFKKEEGKYFYCGLCHQNCFEQPICRVL